MRREDDFKKMKGHLFPEGAFLQRMWAWRQKDHVPEVKTSKPKKVVVPKPHIDLRGIYDGLKVNLTVVDGRVNVKIYSNEHWLKIKEKYLDKAHRPPIGMVTAAMRAWGCSKESIDWTIQRHMANKHDPAWEDDFNRFFPSEKKQTTKKKALKAVVKK